MNKKLIGILASLAAFSVVATGCTNEKPDDTTTVPSIVEQSSNLKKFTYLFNEIPAHVSLKDAANINRAYELYEQLNEQDKGTVVSEKKELDKKAKLCNKLYMLNARTERVGKYVNYSAYKKVVDELDKEYKSLLKLDSSYESDETVVAAKAKLDEANSLIEAKLALLKEFTEKANTITGYFESELQYAEWLKSIEECESIYNQINQPDDDITNSPDLVDVNKKLLGLKQNKQEVADIIENFNKKIIAVDEYLSTYSYSLAKDAQAVAKIEEAKANLAEINEKLAADPVFAESIKLIDGLQAKYDKARFPENCEGVKLNADNALNIEYNGGKPQFLTIGRNGNVTAGGHLFANDLGFNHQLVGSIDLIVYKGTERLPENKLGWLRILPTQAPNGSYDTRSLSCYLGSKLEEMELTDVVLNDLGYKEKGLINYNTRESMIINKKDNWSNAFAASWTIFRLFTAIDSNAPISKGSQYVFDVQVRASAAAKAKGVLDSDITPCDGVWTL